MITSHLQLNQKDKISSWCEQPNQWSILWEQEFLLVCFEDSFSVTSCHNQQDYFKLSRGSSQNQHSCLAHWTVALKSFIRNGELEFSTNVYHVQSNHVPWWAGDHLPSENLFVITFYLAFRTFFYWGEKLFFVPTPCVIFIKCSTAFY